jgi:hypothetical protein
MPLFEHVLELQAPFLSAVAVSSALFAVLALWGSRQPESPLAPDGVQRSAG